MTENSNGYHSNSPGGAALSQHNIPQTPDAYLEHLSEQFQGALHIMKNLYDHNAKLGRDLENSDIDLRTTRAMMRDMQRKLDKLEQLDKNHYMLLLVDGDGMIFLPKYLSAGRAGGLAAARTLANLASANHGGHPIIIKVYANLGGLQRALNSRSPTVNLREFAQGFNDPASGAVTADFIDVGEGKEMADEKLKNDLRWHLKNYNCRSVLVGVSHDNGYARLLSEKGIVNDSRITLIEGPPMAWELTNLGFPKARFQEVFDVSKIVVLPNSSNNNNTAMAPPPGFSSNNKSSSDISGSSGASSSPKFSYAGAAATVPPPASPVQLQQSTSPKMGKVPLTTGYASISPSPQNVTVSRDVMLRIKSLNPRPCNNYYLKDECMFDECRFSHTYTFKADELAAMRKLAKSKKCVWGQECTDERCFYSHEPDGAALGQWLMA